MTSQSFPPGTFTPDPRPGRVPAMLAAPTWPGVVLRPLTDSSVTVPLGVIAPTDDPQGYGQLFYAASSDVLRA